MGDPGVIVVLDAMGVVYQPGADVDELLVPFLRERGCAKAYAEIIGLYNDASRGLMSARELWQRFGVVGDPDRLDRELMTRYSLTEGVTDFLRWCNDASVPVACISNDVSEWASLRARHFGLSDAVASWTISGDVGQRKPDGAIYDAFLATVPSAAACIFVDDRLENVLAAVSRGMRGVLFGAGTATLPQAIAAAPDFPVLRGLIQELRGDSGSP